MTNYIFIGGNVPSSKNSKVWTGKYLVSSKTTRQYIKDTGLIYKAETQNFLDMFNGVKPPFRVGLYFIRKSRHRFDYINACQIIADIMTDMEWIKDDNADFFLPVFLGYHYDKDDAGVFITRIDESEENKETTLAFIARTSKKTRLIAPNEVMYK